MSPDGPSVFPPGDGWDLECLEDFADGPVFSLKVEISWEPESWPLPAPVPLNGLFSI